MSNPFAPAGAAILPDAVENNLQIAFQDGGYNGVFDAATSGDVKWTRKDEGGTCTSSFRESIQGGALRVQSAGSSGNDGYVQSKAIFDLDSKKDIYFSGVFRLEDIANSDAFIGLHISDATIWSKLDSALNGIGFFFDQGVITAQAGNDTTASSVSVSATLTNDTDFEVGFYVFDNCSRVRFYLDGSIVGTITTNLPTDWLAPTFGVRTREAATNWIDCRKVAAFSEFV